MSNTTIFKSKAGDLCISGFFKYSERKNGYTTVMLNGAPRKGAVIGETESGEKISKTYKPSVFVKVWNKEIQDYLENNPYTEGDEIGFTGVKISASAVGDKTYVNIDVN